MAKKMKTATATFRTFEVWSPVWLRVRARLLERTRMQNAGLIAREVRS